VQGMELTAESLEGRRNRVARLIVRDTARRRPDAELVPAADTEDHQTDAHASRETR
jgi:hypothetical protein